MDNFPPIWLFQAFPYMYTVVDPYKPGANHNAPLLPSKPMGSFYAKDVRSRRAMPSGNPEFIPFSPSSLLDDMEEPVGKTKQHTTPGASMNGKTSSSLQRLPYSSKQSPDQLTRDELVLQFRITHEDAHFSLILRNSVWNDFRMDLGDQTFLTRMDETHFQDTCNKSVPIYIGSSDWQYRTMSRVLFNYIYRRWYKPYRNDIYHQRYISKFIALGELPAQATDTSIGANRERPTVPSVRNRPDPCQNVVESLVTMHKQLCSCVEAMSEKEPVDGENQHFIVQPLFRALMILVDPSFYRLEDSKQMGRMRVFMIKTGDEDGLSEPVSFEPIQRKITSRSSYTVGPEETHVEVVRTSLAAAIDLVMTLEARETRIYRPRPNAYITHRDEAMERNVELEQRFGKNCGLLKEGSLDHEWVDLEKYPKLEAAAAAIPSLAEGWEDDSEKTSVYHDGVTGTVGGYRIPQVVMALQERGGFNDMESRFIASK